MIFNYWLDPKGILHDAGGGIAVHNEWAREYLIEKNGEEWFREFVLSPRGYFYEELHKLGWVRITIDSTREKKVSIRGGCMDYTKPMRNTIDPAMNAIQMHIAKLICKDEGFDFEKAINDKIFW